MNEQQEAFKWLMGRDTGMSSKAIMAHMCSGISDGSWPSDPSDLGRCLRLLELIPAWKERIGEMAAYNAVWKIYVENWRPLVDTMTDEVGIYWSKASRAPATYDLMKTLQAQAREVA